MSGIDDIAAERKRQREIEGWSTEHDDRHRDKSMALAAALYATPVPLQAVYVWHGDDRVPHVRTFDPWPWKNVGANGTSDAWDKRKKHDYRRRLVIAGALLAAEIDRLDRAEGK
jgi:hypothetical protein